MGAGCSMEKQNKGCHSRPPRKDGVSDIKNFDCSGVVFPDHEDLDLVRSLHKPSTKSVKRFSVANVSTGWSLKENHGRNQRESQPLEGIEAIYADSRLNSEPGDSDRGLADQAGTQLLYGEILPEGVKKMMGKAYLNADDAKVLLDIGCGRGRLAIQCFDEYDFSRVIGVEVSVKRFNVCCAALTRYEAYCKKNGRTLYREVNVKSGLKECTQNRISTEYIAKKSFGTLTMRKRRLEFYRQDIGQLKMLILEANPTIVTMDVAFSKVPNAIADVLDSLAPGTRVLSYENLKLKWPKSKEFPFSEHHKSIKYKTSWSPDPGYHFYFWKKMRSSSNSKRQHCGMIFD
ncbi:hypothetical protein AAMO2058_001659400 [Amorphochlora amoebiformis]